MSNLHDPQGSPGEEIGGSNPFRRAVFSDGLRDETVARFDSSSEMGSLRERVSDAFASGQVGRVQSLAEEAERLLRAQFDSHLSAVDFYPEKNNFLESASELDAAVRLAKEPSHLIASQEQIEDIQDFWDYVQTHVSRAVKPLLEERLENVARDKSPGSTCSDGLASVISATLRSDQSTAGQRFIGIHRLKGRESDWSTGSIIKAMQSGAVAEGIDEPLRLCGFFALLPQATKGPVFKELIRFLRDYPGVGAKVADEDLPKKLRRNLGD